MKTVDRIITILDAIARSQSGLTSAEISEQLDLSKSTVHRILQSLTEHDLLKASYRGRSKAYSLGLKFLTYSRSVVSSINLVAEAFPIMEQLMMDTHRTVHLAVPQGVDVVYINSVVSPDTPNLFTEVGKKAPITCTSLGKAILAFRNPTQIDSLLSEIDVSRCSDKAYIDREELEAELNSIRERGYAIDDEEYELGIRCVGAPIKDHTNKAIAAISIAGQSRRMKDSDINELGKKIKESAKEITNLLGAKTKNI